MTGRGHRTGECGAAGLGLSLRARTVLIVVIGGVVGGLGVGSGVGSQGDRAYAAASDPDGEGALTVDVTDGTEPQKPGTSPGANSGTPPRSSTRSTSGPAAASVVTQATILDPVAAADALGSDSVAADGLLALSGLVTIPSPSVEIGNGTLTVSFVIRNSSVSAVDSTAEFWVDNAFGARVATLDDLAVDDLEPDETRRVQVVFKGLGQNVLLHVNARLTPPEHIDGIGLDPIHRNDAVFVPPWFSILVASTIAVFARFGWWVYSPRGLGMRFGRFGS